MTSKELERLERIAAQVLAGLTANSHPQACNMDETKAAAVAICRAQELIKQLDALKLPE